MPTMQTATRPAVTASMPSDAPLVADTADASLLQAAPDAAAFKQGSQSVSVSPPPPFIASEGGTPVAQREVTVEFLRFWQGYQKGQRAGFLSNVAERLVTSRVAFVALSPVRAVSASRMVAK